MAGQIYELMPKIASAIGAIGKDQQNKQQGWKFRGIDQVYDAAHRPLVDHGVFVTSEVLDQTREERATKSGASLIYTTIRLKVSWHAPDGSSVSTITVGEGMDSGDKSSPKALSEALKYAYFHTFTIPLAELPDPDSETPEQSTKKSRKTSKELFNEFVIPLVSKGHLTREYVSGVLHRHNNNYDDAFTEIEMHMDGKVQVNGSIV